MALPALPPELAAKLARIMGRLGSDQDGERLAALLAAERLLQRLGLRLHELLAQSVLALTGGGARAESDDVELDTMLDDLWSLCLEDGALPEGQQSVIRSIARQHWGGRELSDRQRQVITKTWRINAWRCRK